MNAPIDLNLVRSFSAVFETGRFSSAGELLGVPRSTVSRAIASLEEQTGLLLFHRTTRTVTPTEAGKALFERIADPLRSLENGLTDLPDRSALPTGTLRVTSTPDFAAAVLAEVGTRFVARYPDVKIEFLLTARLIDLAKENVDLALRIASKTVPGAPNIVTRRVGRISLQLYASPSYLARRGHPTSPADLPAHDWVALQAAASLPLSNASRTIKIDTKPRITSDDTTMVRELVRGGAGICWLPSFLAEADVAEGRLVRVLPRWSAPTGSVHLVYPSRRHVPARVTAFRDLLLESLKQRPLP